MDTSTTGYEITAKLYESRYTLIYRGRQTEDGQSVVLKVLKPEAATTDGLARFKHELGITSRLRLPGVVRTYGLATYQDSLTMVLEDIAGQSLEYLLEQETLGLAHFLELAVWLADTLGSVHQQRIIHKDINPSYIRHYP